MAECGICLGSLFEHEPPIASSSSSQPPLLIERKVVSLVCGHVYHEDCINAWFKEKGRPSNWKCISGCAQKPTTASTRILYFGGNPWEEAERELRNSGGGVKGKAKALEGKVSELSIETSGKEMQRVLGLGGVADLIKEMKRFREEEWVELGQDDVLRSNLTSLTSSLDSLLPKLHYSYKNDSLIQTISELEHKLENAVSNRQSDLDSLTKQHADKIDKLSQQALVKLNSEEDRWKQQRKKDKEERVKEQAKVNVERKGLEQLVERLKQEKRVLSSQVKDLEDSAKQREGSLVSQRLDIIKLKARIIAQKESVKKLEDEKMNSTLVSKSKPKPMTEDVDDDGNFFSDEEMQEGDESLEVGNMSYTSEHAPSRYNTTSYETSSSSSKVLQSSNVNRSTISFDPSTISAHSNKRKAPSEGFATGSRSNKMLPPPKLLSHQSSTTSSLYQTGSSSTLALGRKVSRR